VETVGLSNLSARVVAIVTTYADKSALEAE